MSTHVRIEAHNVTPTAHHANTTLWLSCGDNIILFLKDAATALALGEALIVAAKRVQRIQDIDREPTTDANKHTLVGMLTQ